MAHTGHSARRPLAHASAMLIELQHWTFPRLEPLPVPSYPQPCEWFGPDQCKGPSTFIVPPGPPSSWPHPLVPRCKVCSQKWYRSHYQESEWVDEPTLRHCHQCGNATVLSYSCHDCLRC